MSDSSLPILPGTVEYLALSALARGGRMHGFEVLGWIRRASEDRLQLEEGALYPALHRMEKRKWLEAEWAVSEKGRRAKYYRITAVGRRALVEESRGWDEYVAAVARVATGTGTPRGAEGEV
jgi:PadR family transcriptional regulator PadR